MSVLLDVVTEARELRDRAEHEFRTALVRAKAHHSLAELARAAGMSRPGIQYILRRARGEKR